MADRLGIGRKFLFGNHFVKQVQGGNGKESAFPELGTVQEEVVCSRKLQHPVEKEGMVLMPGEYAGFRNSDAGNEGFVDL